MSQLRVATIGSGAIARGRHLPAYHGLENVDIVATVDTDIARAQSVAETFGIPNVYTNYREMLDRERPELVSICTPPCFHAEAAIEAFAHGAHVICEKPMAKSAGEGQTMIDAAQKAGRLLTVVFNQRYEPYVQALKGYVDSGRLGEAYFGRVRYTHPAIPGYSVHHLDRFSGGGALINSAVHSLDLVLWLMGFPKPIAVSGMTYQKFYKNPAYQSGWANRQDWPDVEDFAAGFVRFHNGAALHIEADWFAVANQRGADVVGTHGEIHFDPYRVYEVNENGQAIEVTLEPPGDWNGHERLIADVVNCVRTGGQPLVKPAEALCGQRIMDALYASAKQGCEVRLE